MINGNPKGLSDRKVSAIGVEDLDRFYAALRERGGKGGRPLAGSTVARTHTMVRQRSDGVNLAVLFNQRRDPSGHDYFVIREQLDAVADAVFRPVRE